MNKRNITMMGEVCFEKAVLNNVGGNFLSIGIKFRL